LARLLPHWIDEHGNALGPGQQLMQQYQSFGYQLGGEEVEPRNISTRPIEARYQTHLHGVPAAHEYDRNGLCRALGRGRCGRPRGEDHRYLTPDEISSKLRQSLRPAVGRAVRDRHLLPLDEAFRA
jgi:hypothetical protein